MANFTVTNTNDSGVGSLRHAIVKANARSGADTVTFDSALSGKTIHLTSGQMKIKDDITIEGLGADQLTIDAGGRSRIFYAVGRLSAGRTTDVTMQGLTLTGGFSSDSGGAIFVGHHYYSDLNLTISDSIVTQNRADDNGGAIYSEKSHNPIVVRNSTFSENSVKNGSGGAIFAKRLAVFDSSINNNKSYVSGGGITSTGFVGVVKTNIYENETQGFGGGFAGEEVIVEESTIAKNRAGLEGGGIRTEGASIILKSAILENEADENGGGISVSHLNPVLSFGGDKTMLLANTTVSGNKARGNGGGIQVLGQEISLVPTRGLVGENGNLFATNVTITNNTADSDNNGEGNGGGVYTFSSGVFGDLSTRRYILRPGSMTFENSIIAGNFDTPENSGIGFIAPDIDGTAKGNANNLLGSTQGLTIEAKFTTADNVLGSGSDIVSANPGLGPLQNNGGPTLTHALLPGSPAINGGNNDKILRETLMDIKGTGRLLVLNFDQNAKTKNAQIPHDQRRGKFRRVVNGIVDIGAFEVQETIDIDESNNATLGTKDDDQLEGTQGSDILFGLDGNDFLFGKDGQDHLNGDAGNDILNGNDGDDLLFGGTGQDHLWGGTGNDTLNGGAEEDIFIMALNSGTDIIADFLQGTDTIGLTEGLSFGTGGNVTSQIQEGKTLLLANGETLAEINGTFSLNANDFQSINI